MKKITFLLFLVLILPLCLHSQVTAEKFKLVFEENFEKDGNPNSKHWEYCPRISPDWGKYLVSNNPQTVRVENGKLLLSAIKNPNTATDNVPYLTGGIQTRNKVGIKYGKVEVRAKVPEGKGSFPAIWMMPTNSTYGGWPKSGEIDIMEHLNTDNVIYQTIHSYYATGAPYGQGNNNPKSSNTTGYNKNDFNIYGLEWYPDKLEFLVNGVVTSSYPRLNPSVSNQWPFDHEFYLILNTACNGSWGGAVNDSHLPFIMEIDWVKMYELTPDRPYNTPGWTGSFAYNDPKLKDTYIQTITSTGIEKPVSYNVTTRPTEYYSVYTDTLKVISEKDFSLNLKAFSLGEYSTSVIKQDLRYTCVYVYTDFNGDKVFENALPRVGKIPPTNGVGGNMESLDATFNFKAPKVTKEIDARIRVVYHNAWSTHAGPDYPLAEGNVYDFNVKFQPINTSINTFDYQPIARRNGSKIEISGLISPCVASLFDSTGRLISNTRISEPQYSIDVPNSFVILKLLNDKGAVFSIKL